MDWDLIFNQFLSAMPQWLKPDVLKKKLNSALWIKLKNNIDSRHRIIESIKQKIYIIYAQYETIEVHST